MNPTVDELKAMGLCGPDVMSVRDMLSRGYGESESSARALMDFVNDNTNGFFGIEELRDTDPDGESVLLCLYLNSGDTYDTTLCWVPGEGFVVASWAISTKSGSAATAKRTTIVARTAASGNSAVRP